MTMKELAKLANVSCSTVSKAFRDAEDISEETRDLVFEIAKENGCFMEFYKGKYSKPIIAILCPELRSGYYSGYVEKLQQTITAAGGIALISTHHFDRAVQAELIEYYGGYLKVDGIFAFNLNIELKAGMKQKPIVALFNSRNTDLVTVDFAAPIAEAVAHLKALGHRKLAFIGESLTIGKERAFCACCEEQGLEAACIRAASRFEEAGKEGARRILEMQDRPTAVVCAYDDIAIGLIRRLKKSGYSVPQDFSVIGMDDINSSEHLETPLTTIDSNPAEVCRIAWDLMEKKLKNRHYTLRQKITITGRLLIRETTAPLEKKPRFD